MKSGELVKIRNRLGWTQQELATALGVARNTVTRWEIDLVTIPEPMAKLIKMIAAQAKEKKKKRRK